MGSGSSGGPIGSEVAVCGISLRDPLPRVFPEGLARGTLVSCCGDCLGCGFCLTWVGVEMGYCPGAAVPD